MGDPSSNIEQIAEGLNSDQRWLLLELPAEGERRWAHGLPPSRLSGLCKFGKSGLVASRYERSGVSMALTEDGLAVRAHLIAQGGSE